MGRRIVWSGGDNEQRCPEEGPERSDIYQPYRRQSFSLYPADGQSQHLYFLRRAGLDTV